MAVDVSGIYFSKLVRGATYKITVDAVTRTFTLTSDTVRRTVSDSIADAVKRKRQGQSVKLFLRRVS